MIETFKGERRFSFLYDDALEDSSEIPLSIADMSEETPEQKRKSFQVILKETALSLCTRKGQ